MSKGDPRIVPDLPALAVDGLASIHLLRIFADQQSKNRALKITTRAFMNAVANWLTSVADKNWQHAVDNAPIDPTGIRQLRIIADEIRAATERNR